MKRSRLLLLTLSFCTLSALAASGNSALAACAELPQDKGRATAKFTSQEGEFRVWARILAPVATDDSFLLTIDDAYCGIVVGDSGKLPANEFVWVNHQNGDINSLITVKLATGEHTLTATGRDVNVGLDKIMLVPDACVPVDTGENCKQAVVTPIQQPVRTEDAPAAPVSTPNNTKRFLALALTLIALLYAAIVLANYMWPGWSRRLLKRLPWIGDRV